MLFYKRGQATIFIIIGILVVAGIVLFFVLRGGVGGGGLPSAEDQSPEEFLRACISEEGNIKGVLNEIARNGGSIEPGFSTNFRFEEEGTYQEISYLCYAEGFGETCTNQKPSLLSHVEDEIEGEFAPNAEDCFNQMISSYEDRNYEINNEEYRGLEVNFEGDRLIFGLDVYVGLSKTNESIIHDDIVEVGFWGSNLPGFVDVAQEIVNSEVVSCDFDQQGYGLLYSEYTIDSYSAGEDIIYVISHDDSQTKFRFAVRNCVTQ